jgi:crotonobetainyl-CoA:carnitine CoA-transferase CaiB-like acyl-CoA transferase
MRVLDLSHVMAGPVCGLMLADMGADVVKIERIPVGDDSRQILTPSIEGESAAFMMMNRNKRGLALDLKKAKGQEVLKRLVRTTDALIENYRKGTMEKFGLGYDALSAINPGLVYCEISGFGRTGPLASQGGFDLVTQGMSGLMSITGEGPGRPPVKVGAPVTDITAGLLACLGICAAYAHKLRTGQGQRVDTSLFEAGIVQTYWQSAIAFATGVSPGPLGSAHPLSAPYQAFETSDGWITLGTSNQKTWQQFIEVLDAPEIAGDARFSDNAGRMANLPQLVAALAPHFKRRATAEWLAILGKAGVPAGDARASPDQGAGHGAGRGSCHRRQAADARHAHQVLRHARGDRPRRAGLRAAQPRDSARGGLRGLRNRGPAGRERGRGAVLFVRGAGRVTGCGLAEAGAAAFTA